MQANSRITQTAKCHATKYFIRKMEIYLTIFLMIVVPGSCEPFTNLIFVPVIENKYTNTSLNGFYDEFMVSFLMLSNGNSIQSIISIANDITKMLDVTITSSSYLDFLYFDNPTFDNTYQIKITANTWSSIVISQYFINNTYNITAAVNGSVQYSNTNTQPMVFTDVIFLYTFYECSFHPNDCNYGSIKNLSIYSKTQIIWSQWSEWSQCNKSLVKTRTRSCSNNQWLNCIGNSSDVTSCSNPECFIMKNETQFVYGKWLTTLKKLSKEYSLYFEIKPTAFKTNWTNVIHLTTGENQGTYGDRNLIVLFCEKDTCLIPGRLKIGFVLSGNMDRFIYSTNLVGLGVWSSIKIMQEYLQGKYMYSIQLNGENIFNEENTDAKELYNVKVYISNVWHEVQPGLIRNLKITNDMPETKYRIRVKTGDLLDSGTFANVYLILFGKNVSSETLELKESSTNIIKFQHGNTDIFLFSMLSLGILTKLRVWHDNTNILPGWFLSYIEVIDGSTNETFMFPCERWFAKDEDDKSIVREIETNSNVTREISSMIDFKNCTILTPCFCTNGSCVNMNGLFICSCADGWRLGEDNASCIASSYLKNKTQLLNRNLVTTINRLFKEYTVSFEVKLTAEHNKSSNPLNVFHLTTDDNVGVYGYQTPAMWIQYGTFHICSAVNGNHDYCVNQNVFEPGNYNSFKISQQLINGKYMYSIEHNCTSICYKENNDSREFLDVKVYISDPWHEAQPGFIRNFKITNGKPDEAVWSQWSNWSICDNTQGYINRTRECNVSNDFDWCCGHNFDLMECYAFWLPWSISSSCNDSYGLINKTRNCNVSNAIDSCYGIKSEEMQNSAFWAQWSDWSDCNETNGFMNRTRECILLNILVWCYVNNSGLLEYSEIFLMESETLLSKGNLITTIQKLSKEYSVYFEINPTCYQSSWIQNVFHLSVDLINTLDYGEGNPSVWFEASGLCTLYICFNVNNKIKCMNKISIEKNTWSSIKISQELLKGKYIHSIHINGEYVSQVENKDAREFLNGKVYVSDPWYEVHYGYIRNIKITNVNPAFLKRCHNLSNCNNTHGLINSTRMCSESNSIYQCNGINLELKKCYGVIINVEENQLQTASYKTIINMLNCNNVELLLNFGDGKSVTHIKNINASTLKNCTYTENHRYSVCQPYTINAYVKKFDGNTTTTLFTNSTNVTVFCNLSPLNVITTPPISLSGYIQLTLNKSITLNIYQDTGSNMIYSIDWGDSNTTINNQTLNSSPVSFQVQHMYTSINNFNISVTCRNYLQELSPISFHIQVTNCSMPEVYFYYGTVYNPMAIIKSVGRDLSAFVESVSSLCKNELFTFEWSLTTSDLKPIVTQQKGVLYHNKVTYSIAKNTLNFGIYILSLQCSYGNVSTVYTACLNVIFSPLYMDIENGMFVSIAYIKKIRNESFYQNFKVSALSSYDPDDPTIGVQNIIFRWRCKVASNFSDAKAAMDNFTLINLTFLSNTCFNETWIDIPSIFSELSFSTKQFLEGISYHIEVCGTKYAGKDVYLNDVNKTSCIVQEVLISGSVPTVTLKCISNCDTKLNFKERIIYSFACEDCGYRRLDANWAIEDDKGVFPSELNVQNATSTGFRIPSLVINKDILLESKNYTFILLVGYANSASRAQIKFKKSTCSQPTPGYCVINPAEGFALETKFILYCNGWRDYDGLLSYAFYYDNGQSQQMEISSVTSIDFPILNAGITDQPSLIFVMGPGDEKNDNKIRILIKVIGKYQAYTEYNLYIKVYPNHKQTNLKDMLTGTDLSDTQSITNIVQAVSNNINTNSANQYNITSAFDNELFGMVDDETLKQLKLQRLSDLQELRTQLIDLINNTSFEDLNSFKSISDALVVTLQNPLEIVPYAQNKAVSIVDKLAGLLTKKNLKGFGAEKFNTMSQSFVNSISSLLQPAISTSFNLSKPDERLVPTLIKSMEDYFIAVQSFKVPGENKTVGVTKQFDFLLKKDIYIDLSSNFIGSHDGGFSFPDSKDLFNDSLQNSQISIHNVRIKDVVYTWDTNRSQNILTETQSLFFLDSNGRPIKVSNSSQPINVTIKNKPEKMNGQNISLSMPNDPYQLTLPITSDCKMLLKFVFKNDENNLTNLIVYIQYGKTATAHDYDIMLNISFNHGVVMTKNYNVTNTVVLNSNNKINKDSTKVLQRNQDVFLLTDGAIILWNFKNSTYSLFNKSELSLMFMYSGPIPAKSLVHNTYDFTEAEYSGKYDYEMKSFCVECNYWNEDTNKWMSDGCQLDVHYTSFLMTECICNHLTTFGGFFVAPNRLPTLSLAKLKHGYALLVAVLIVISLWLVGLLITRRMDKQDISKIGICPLFDNRDEDTYLYQIIVNTGTRRNAGTKSNIFFTLVGDIKDSGVRRLKDPVRNCFQRSSCDIFIMTTPSTLGELDFVWLWHDNCGGGWYLKNIIIIDIQTEKRFFFIAQCWIAVDSGSCKLDTVIPVASLNESSSFVYVYKNKIQHKLHNEHLWFSIFFRSPKSNFTRCQRLSVGVSLILTSMMVSTMFYHRVPPEDPAVENKTGKFVFTWTQVFVMLISTLIKFPINFILVKLFCSMKQFPRNEPHYCSSCVTNNITQKRSYSCVHTPENSARPNKRRVSISIERSKFYITWFICAGNIFSCGFVVLWYGMAFGNKKSLIWLASVIIDFFKGILVLEPLKILIVVVVIILVVKKFDDEKENIEMEKQGRSLASDENWLRKPKDELSTIDNDIALQPPDNSTVKKMRKLRLKLQKIHSIGAELIYYIFYAFLVFFIGFFSRNILTFYQTRNVQELFNLKLKSPVNPNIPVFHNKVFNKIQSSQDFWHWMEGFFLPQVFPEPWYNLSDFYANTDKKDFPGKLFLNDLTSKVINGIRIRQVRVMPNSCSKANSVSKLIKINCLSSYKTTQEETRDFDLNWTIPKQYNSTINSLTMPWRYQTWQKLDGYPFAADLETYFGGGYVIELFSKWKNQVILDQAKKCKWVDRQTRAIIIEFALFNAATNYFTMVTMVLEFTASGGIAPNYSVLTFNLYASVNGSKVMLGFHILFILITMVFTIRESRFLYRAGSKYFVEFWNLVEVAMILFSVAAVGLFFYKDYLAKKLLQRLLDKKPQLFINFQFAYYCDIMYISIVSFIVFFVTLKFIKLLQFNHHVSMISYTLKAAWYPLSMFGIVFFIILCSFATFSNIAFGEIMVEYKTYFEAIVSTVSLLLGKFSFNQYKTANNVLGPLFFFGFNVIAIWFIMNIFISILNNAFTIVRANPEYQNNDYEIVEYILECFKGWFKSRQKNTPSRTKSARKPYPKNKIIKVTEHDKERLSNCDPGCSTGYNGYCSRDAFEKKFNKLFFDVKGKVKNKDLKDTNGSINLTFEDLFSKFDYLLNKSKLDIEISETIDQIFDNDLFQKFIVSLKAANINNKI